MTLTTNALGINLIKKYEGLRLKMYICPAGYRTIGYGHLVQDGEPLSITEAQADAYLADDIRLCEARVRALLTAPTTENQFSALVAFAFNVGVRALSGSSVLKYHNRGLYGDAVRAFGAWNKAKVNGVLRALDGLTERRGAEQGLYLRPQSNEGV
jgi:lysozyme